MALEINVEIKRDIERPNMNRIENYMKTAGVSKREVEWVEKEEEEEF